MLKKAMLPMLLTGTILAGGMLAAPAAHAGFTLLGIGSLTGTAAALKEWLMENHGILIRDAANFYGLLQGHCRVACRSTADNTLLITALRQWTLY